MFWHLCLGQLDFCFVLFCYCFVFTEQSACFGPRALTRAVQTNTMFCLDQVVGVPVGSTLPSTVKQAVAISSGQILVAKASSSVAKAVGPKQVVTQGVAKAIVSGGGGTIVAQPVQTLTKTQVTAAGPPKSGSQGSGN